MNVTYGQLVRIFLLRGKYKVNFNFMNAVVKGQYCMGCTK